MSQFHVLTMLGESFVKSLTVVLPFFPTGTMERVVREGDVATANTMAKMFSHLPSGAIKNRLMLCTPRLACARHHVCQPP